MRDMTELKTARDNFKQTMLLIFQAGYLERLETIKALPPVVEPRDFTQSYKRLEQTASPEAQQALLRLGRKWNVWQ